MSRILFAIVMFACISCAAGDAKKTEAEGQGSAKDVLRAMVDSAETYPVNFVYTNLGNYPDNVIVPDIPIREVKGSVLMGLSNEDIRAFGDSLIVVRNVPDYHDVLVLCKGKPDMLFNASVDDFENVSVDSFGRLPIYAEGALSADVNSYKWKSGSAQRYFSYHNHDVFRLRALVSPKGDFECLDTAVTVFGCTISFRDLKDSAKVNDFMSKVEKIIAERR